MWHRGHSTNGSGVIAEALSAWYLAVLVIDLYPFRSLPMEMMEEASIHPGVLDGFLIASLELNLFGERRQNLAPRGNCDKFSLGRRKKKEESGGQAQIEIDDLRRIGASTCLF